MVGFKETGDVQGAVAFDREGDLVEGGDENVDWELGFIFGEAAKGDGEFEKMFLSICKVTIFGILLL